MSSLTEALIARHAPKGPGGKEAALIDIAQDQLLGTLASQGNLDLLVLKGGTAIRKFYAGSSGRFSTDLNFALRSMADSQTDVTELLVSAINGMETDDFRYTVVGRRGKFSVRYETSLGNISALSTKLDIGPPIWLEPTARSWISMPVHGAYELPAKLPMMSSEENLSEKVARLNRRTLARDLYDLWWISGTSPLQFFRPAIGF